MSVLHDAWFFQFMRHGDWDSDRYLWTDFDKCRKEAQEFYEETRLPVRIIGDGNRIDWSLGLDKDSKID